MGASISEHIKGTYNGRRAVGTGNVEMPKVLDDDKIVGFNDDKIANPFPAVISTIVLIMNSY